MEKVLKIFRSGTNVGIGSRRHTVYTYEVILPNGGQHTTRFMLDAEKFAAIYCKNHPETKVEKNY